MNMTYMKEGSNKIICRNRQTCCSVLRAEQATEMHPVWIILIQGDSFLPDNTSFHPTRKIHFQEWKTQSTGRVRESTDVSQLKTQNSVSSKFLFAR